jgi:hypothetical protein
MHIKDFSLGQDERDYAMSIPCVYQRQTFEAFMSARKEGYRQVDEKAYATGGGDKTQTLEAFLAQREEDREHAKLADRERRLCEFVSRFPPEETDARTVEFEEEEAETESTLKGFTSGWIVIV